MIELLISPKAAKREPWQVMLLAALFVSLAIVVNLALPSLQGGVVTFAMVPAIPLIWTLLVREEREEEKRLSLLKKNPLEYHLPLIEVFAYFFVGAAIAYAGWYAALAGSAPATADSLFDSQLKEISAIGMVAASSGSFIRADFAANLFSHNLTVLVFMFLFTLIYGIGSVYLLLWNASIIGVFVGRKLATVGLAGFLQSAVALLPHGSLEIGAYFLASIAGGILSAALMHQHHKREEFKYILKDVAVLSLISVVALGLAALLESFG